MEEKNKNNLGEDMKNVSETEMENITVEPTPPPASIPESEDIILEPVDLPTEYGASPSPTEEPAEAEAPREEPAVYAYRWDYTEQARYDKTIKSRADVKGIRNFAIIMSVAFLLSIVTLLGVLVLDLPRGNTDAASASLDALYEECYPSYVAISVISESGTNGAGSGIIMTSDGYISTNYHVVETAKTINVILHDGTTVEAEYIDGDELNDIAILKIDKRGLTPAVIGRSASVRVGERVMAIGTPYSIQYRGTMTSGYISALDRRYAAKNDNGTVNKVITLLQTDTSVNPGNSGGPLFNMDGEVIGIVSMKIAGSEYEGMGFAIPIDGVINMLWDIIENGELTISNGGSAFEGAALGITGQTVVKDSTYLYSGEDIFLVETDVNGEQRVIFETIYGTQIPIPLSDTELLAEYGITDYTLYTAPESGCRVMNIAEGFDAAKHLKIDDIILKANGISCEYMETLQEIIANSRVGDKIDFEILRDGEIIWLTVELGRSAAME